jgi:hypothetical protein
MPTERIIRSPHVFWEKTCGIDTWRRSNRHAILDTAWNAFTPDRLLINTVWSDDILPLIDPANGKERRFVQLGGQFASWQGGAIERGRKANDNILEAFKSGPRARVLGYEAEPVQRGIRRKKIKYFYVDRPLELRRVSPLWDADLMERLELEARFIAKAAAEDDRAIELPVIFEIVAPAGPFPVICDDEHVEVVSLFDNEIIRPANKSNEEYAELVIPILVAHVFRQRDDVMRVLTYEDLAGLVQRLNKHDMPAARGMGGVLGTAMEMIEAAVPSIDVPYLTTIVVLKTGEHAGLPDVGVRLRWPRYSTMTEDEKFAKVENEYARILRFGTRWNDVLVALGMDPIVLPEGEEASKAGGGWGGGESDEHKALKAYVMDHPELFGADANCERFTEYPLRSGDSIDVFFKSPDVWIGVEVKSIVSEGNDLDYQRGLYQVVKYEAVLRAQAKADLPSTAPTIKVFLALQAQLPNHHRDTALRLGIAVRETITPT